MADANTPQSSLQLAADQNLHMTGVDHKDPFWYTDDTIDHLRWNQSFPYQLIVVTKNGNGSYVDDRSWRFTLPIPPESLTLSMPFAIEGKITQGGYVEDHSGVPIRFINISGTTGVQPLRGLGTGLSSLSIGRAIFAGTINQFNNFTSAISQFKSNFTGVDAPQNLLPSQLDIKEDAARGSGYYQFRLLQRFLENYAMIKTKPEGKNLRLAFAMWKDQAVYLVTPMPFDVSRSAGSPFEYKYRMGFKAWRRITLSSPNSRAFDAGQPLLRQPNELARSLKAIQDARRILQRGRDTILAVASDADRTFFEPMRQIALFIKDALGVGLAVADLPKQIVQDMRGPVLEFMSTQQALNTFGSDFDSRIDGVGDALDQIGNAIEGAQVTGNGFATNTRGVSENLANSSDGAQSIFNDPLANYDFFSSLNIGNLSVNPQVSSKINNERQNVRTFKRLDFEKARDQLVAITADFSQAVGAGDPVYDELYSRPSVPTTRVPNDDDWEIIYSFNNLLTEYDKLAASETIDRFKVDSIDHMAALARRSGIAFTTPKSKFAVPFPFGSTIEMLAQTYLGNADRAPEIIALNGLRSPYVDEEGFELDLLVNGEGNEIVVPFSQNLYINQSIYIFSSTAAKSKRRILRIETIGSESTLTLDGDPDLNQYLTIAKAKIHAYLPDTINSQQLVYIPSQEDSIVSDSQVKAIPGINQFDQYLAVGGIDLMLTPTNDLAFKADGDIPLAIGLTNIIQKLRIATNVPRGSLLLHPGYGLGIKIGSNTADVNPKDIMESLRSLIAGDKTFSSIQGISVQKKGPATAINMAVGIAGVQELVPVSLTLRNNL